jgi:hypothetical protein
MYRCDGCQTTAEPAPIPERWKKNAYMAKRDRLPVGWMELTGKRNDDELFNAQYCKKCTTEVERLLQGLALSFDGIQITSDNLEGNKVSGDNEERYHVENICFKSRADAVTVLDALRNQAERCPSVTVSDYYDLAGFPSQFTDQHWGWRPKTIEHDAYISQLVGSNEFAISLPQPVSLKTIKGH